MASYDINKVGEEAKVRYWSKLRSIDLDVCPYQIPADSWLDDPTKWPMLEWPEVYDYLINTPGVYTREAMKNRKSLEAHNQFTSGWVRTVYCYRKKSSNIMLLKAEVMPSQRLSEEPHIPWIALSISSTSVIAAHCTCMAGLGESCSHVGALLFKVEAAVRIGYTQKACTDIACQWNNDFVKKIKPVPISQVKFYTDKAVTKSQSSKFKDFKNTYTKPSQSEMNELLTNLSALPSRGVVLHAYSDYCDSFIPSYKPPERAKLPKNLRCYYSQENVDKSEDELNVLSVDTLKNIKLAEETITYVEKVTQKQSKCLTWFQMRTGRITASKIYDVLHTDAHTPSHSLIKSICKDTNSLSNTQIPSLKWGIDNEEKAIDDFIFLKTGDEAHTDFKVKCCGLTISHEYPFLGASPDRKVECKCHEEYIIEVKCPYAKRDTNSVTEAVSDDNFYLDKNTNLKRGHKYYYQIQFQMFICGFKKCELVVWTPNWIHCESVLLDSKFIEERLDILKNFFVCHILPELLTRKLENRESKKFDGDAEKLYCFCKSRYSEDETWIGCDAENCKWEWFHLSCVKLKRIPKGNWYCRVCRRDKKKSGQVKRKIF